MTDELLGFGEFALALAGFAAIALVFGRREGVLAPGNAYVVQFMVVNALGPALLAVLAVVLLRLGVPVAAALRTCSAVYLAAAAFFAVLSARRERRLASAGELVIPPGLGRAIWGGSWLAHAIMLSNLVGFPAAPSVGVLLLGLWVLVALAAVQFVALLFLTLR